MAGPISSTYETSHALEGGLASVSDQLPFVNQL